MNPDFAITGEGDGHFSLRGELSFATVPMVAEQCLRQLWQTDNIVLDLAGITRTDSAGLALLVGWIRSARKQKKHISYRNIPEQMMVMASVVGLSGLLKGD